MDRKEVSFEGVEWIDLAQNREKLEVLVDTAVDFRIPYTVWNFLTD
jgi:predicted nucleotidyltransferase